jgi:phosphoribosylformylglycinamidine synthase
MNAEKTLILTGMGLNCERETEYACKKSGAKEIDKIHILQFLGRNVSLESYNFIVFIGGFADGDYLGSARVAVNRLKYKNLKFQQQLLKFIDDKKLILGICNGFQLLVKLGILPDDNLAFVDQIVSLTNNSHGQFENRWVHLKINPCNKSIFTRGMDTIYLPIRHGEGRIVANDAGRRFILRHNSSVMHYADETGDITLEYPDCPNKSWMSIAALSNINGNIMGMMPHPEAYNHYTNHPQWARKKFDSPDGEGLKIFKNAYNYLN